MAKLVYPLHADILPRLDPQYIVFHNQCLLQRPQPNDLPWDPAIRNAPAVPGGSAVLQVGSVKDFSVVNCNVRVFTPEGTAPTSGWPVFIFFHGGEL